MEAEADVAEAVAAAAAVVKRHLRLIGAIFGLAFLPKCFVFDV
jgi:hypothetical protein